MKTPVTQNSPFYSAVSDHLFMLGTRTLFLLLFFLFIDYRQALGEIPLQDRLANLQLRQVHVESTQTPKGFGEST